ncbi:MAG: hypothetical protein ACYS1C_11465, partial [Planctomycetota bacterium]
MNPFWLLLVMATVAFWLHLTSWVSEDAKGAGLDHLKSALLILAFGLLGFALTLLHAVFALMMLILVLGGFGVYIGFRNRVVPERYRFLGAYHRSQLLSRIPGLGGLATVRPKLKEQRSATGLTGRSGESLDDIVAERPVLADAAGMLARMLRRGGMVKC